VLLQLVAPRKSLKDASFLSYHDRLTGLGKSLHVTNNLKVKCQVSGAQLCIDMLITFFHECVLNSASKGITTILGTLRKPILDRLQPLFGDV